MYTNIEIWNISILLHNISNAKQQFFIPFKEIQLKITKWMKPAHFPVQEDALFIIYCTKDLSWSATILQPTGSEKPSFSKF